MKRKIVGCQREVGDRRQESKGEKKKSRVSTMYISQIQDTIQNYLTYEETEINMTYTQEKKTVNEVRPLDYPDVIIGRQ